MMKIFFFNDTATTEIYTLSLHHALPISRPRPGAPGTGRPDPGPRRGGAQRGLRRGDRRARRPGDDGFPHHPRPRGDRRPGRPRGHPRGRPGGRGGGDGGAQGALVAAARGDLHRGRGRKGGGMSLHGMKALVGIAGRELRRRWMILPAALVVGFVPVVAPRLGWKAVGDPVVGLLLCLLLGTMTALATGYSAIGGEIAAGRLGFFFSRPVPWWAIWGGKFSASVLLTALAGVLAALPWMTARVGQSLSPTALMDFPGSFFAAGLVLLAVGLAHAARITYGSRSRFVAPHLPLLP